MHKRNGIETGGIEHRGGADKQPKKPEKFVRIGSYIFDESNLQAGIED